MTEHYYKAGDLVILKNDDYTDIRAGTLASSVVYRHLVNVTFPKGTWAFPKWELKPLTKEVSCK